MQFQLQSCTYLRWSVTLLSFSLLGHTIFDVEVFKARRQAFLPALGSYLNTPQKRNSYTQLDRDLTVFLVLTAEALGICTHYLSGDILIATVLDKVSQLVVGELIEDKAQSGEQAGDTSGTSSPSAPVSCVCVLIGWRHPWHQKKLIWLLKMCRFLWSTVMLEVHWPASKPDFIQPGVREKH